MSQGLSLTSMKRWWLFVVKARQDVQLILTAIGAAVVPAACVTAVGGTRQFSCYLVPLHI